MVSESPGRNASEPVWPRKDKTRRPSLPFSGEGSMERCMDFCGATLRLWKGQHGDKVMLSNWRNPPRPVAKSAEQGSRITGDTGKSVEGERDSAGSVVARKRSNVRGAKRPCCL